MAERHVSPALKLALELGPVLLFFVAYVMLRDETYFVNGTEYDAFILITAAFVPLMALSMLALWLISGTLGRMQIVTLVVVVVFGGLTVWLNDERFFKLKPTIIYALFAGVLWIGLLRGESWLQAVMDGMVPLQREGWMVLTRRLALFFAALALVNLVVAQLLSTDAWVSFRTFVLPAAVFGFFIAQARVFNRFGIDKPDADKSG